jgi:NitT/TauT family transport system substrate-binding protein
MDKKVLTALAAVVVVAIAIGAVIASGVLTTPPQSNVIYYKTYLPSQQKTVIGNHSVDGGIMWEPFVSDNVLSGTGHVLINSKDLFPNHPCCVIVVREEFAEAHPDLVKAVLKAHIEANKWMADAVDNKIANPDNYSKLLSMGASFSGVSEAAVAASLEDMVLDYHLTTAFRSGMANFTQMYLNTTPALLQMTDITGKGYSSVQNFIDNYLNDSYLAAADAVLPSETSLGTVSLAYLTGDLHQFARVVAMNTTLFPGGKNLFQIYGVTIADPQPGGYPNGGGVMTAIAAGNLANGPNMGYLGCAPAIRNYLTGDITKLNTRIVAAVNSEGSALVVDSDIHTVKDLGGKVVATPGVASIQQLMLIEIAKQYNMTLSVK